MHTKDVSIQSSQMGFFQKVLDRLSDPNISYMLMMLGFFGILFELFNPGLIFPGIAGVIFLILAFYSMSSMPVNYAGLALIVFGIILFLLEIKIVSHGLLSIGGIISVLLGSMFLIRDSPLENIVSVSKSIIFATTGVTSAFFIFMVTMALKAQRLKPVTGSSALVGLKGIAMQNIDTNGLVKIKDEIWKAVSAEKINEGDTVIVKRVKGLTLYVETA